VAYWDPHWKEIWLGERGLVSELARLGFDGIYLDWVEAYEDRQVVRAARKAGLKPAAEMLRFIEELAATGRRVTPDFLVVAQNAPYLIDVDEARYVSAIDGLAVEDTWFSGTADAEWNDPQGGDLPNRDEEDSSTAGRLTQYGKYLKRGLPVFSVDYCLRPENAARVYREARRAGLRPLVTRVSLSRMTGTPPPWQIEAPSRH
jgi:cysteinyl-tRNA synthetase